MSSGYSGFREALPRPSLSPEWTRKRGSSSHATLGTASSMVVLPLPTSAVASPRGLEIERNFLVATALSIIRYCSNEGTPSLERLGPGSTPALLCKRQLRFIRAAVLRLSFSLARRRAWKRRGH